MSIAIRNADCCAFHCSDCHIKYHSPPIPIRPRNQRQKPSVSPAMAVPFARSNAVASSCTVLRSAAAPAQHKNAIVTSTKMIAI
jgi:hypothetical protein